jgi:hypothetical protein
MVDALLTKAGVASAVDRHMVQALPVTTDRP